MDVIIDIPSLLEKSTSFSAPQMFSVDLSCRICYSFFKQTFDRDDEQYEKAKLNETGLCSRCVSLCIMCEKRKFDTESIQKLCAECLFDCQHAEEVELRRNKENDVVEGEDQKVIEGGEDKHQDKTNDEQDGGENNREAENPEDEGNMMHADNDEEEGGAEVWVAEEEEENVGDCWVGDDNIAPGNMCKVLCSIFDSSNGDLGANGDFGPTNGEMGDDCCKKLVKLLNVGPNDKILDIGSGGGVTIARLQALSNCDVGVGIEIVAIRHSIAVNFNKHLMDKLPDMDVRITFLNDDVDIFSNFNGFSKVVMYDKAFDDGLMRRIGQRFNRTTTVQLIASTKKLIEYDFDVDYVEDTGNSMKARGGKMAHKFYIYRSRNFVDFTEEPEIIEPKFSESFNVARCRTLRLEDAEIQLRAFQTSEKYPRASQLNAILCDSFKKSAQKLFLLLNSQRPMVRNVDYEKKPVKKTKQFVMHNLRPLDGHRRFEMDAVSSLSLKKSLLVPSFDGKIDGKILVGLIFDDKNSNNKYEAIVYDLKGKKFEIEIPFSGVFDMFDYENSMPFDLDVIIEVSIKDLVKQIFLNSF